MQPWSVRDFHADDLDQVISVWQASRTDSVHPVYTLSEIIRTCSDDLAVVAVVRDEVIGAVTCMIQEDRAWILMLAQASAWRGQGLGSALLAGLERRLADQGIRRISALLPASETRVKAFRNSEYRFEEDLHYFERILPVQPQEMPPLTHLGGRILPRGLWDGLAGMQHEKELIEQRLILPLARPDLANSLGVVPPQAVVLFGPPGTGKTTFAKAVASRLDWPFVEVFPSRLAADPQGLAAALRQTFLDISGLDHVVVFIDEVEEIASARNGERASVLQGVTNELLKIIPAFREQPGGILICATNFIRSLDLAFLRHGRFDYVIPIGAPDAAARAAIWRRYIPGTATEVDIDLLAAASERFSPADIEFAARKTSQNAFEQAVLPCRQEQPEAELSTDAYLTAITETRATVTEATVKEFLEDIERIARI
ncbi:AAA family ATPase [Arthrobacter sp. MYb23]|uniref:ATP-binding protein n=1 Tax=unclassified Arthrobacter TaxID=235627 RepID=UPI000CFCB56F|nr:MULTISPECIES: GNAT family N-acetyltransferase [unclassified Arthrobacter]PRB43019.1 AAA family ATPase [Arthrobacter sp. MYb51]PRB97972.1 AAA family ATPase [Arthrobacter sp. MYb23]